MIEANLTPEELDILQYVHEFAQREVKPLAREIDRNKEVPGKLIDRMNEMGLFPSYIPREYGGAGL
ncbi:MAG: acyl-CoA dehydrogenase family protein, partial [Candidatus Thermoplasmatota archaeon]|nr:acyl-CoA dehydrogenase family protein [Candidatus Thermoplasmatota archaeon]